MNGLKPRTGLHPTRIADDAELLERAVEGDSAAFAEIVDRHHGPAYAAARRILGPSPAAEDVVQEALLQLWRSGSQFSPERGSLRSWLLVLVRSRAIDLVRRESVRAAATQRAQAMYVEDPVVVREEAERRDDARRLKASIVNLPREQAQVLGLQFVAGRSQSEIATSLGIPLGTIKGRTRLALSKLRRELAGAELAV